MQRCKIGAVWVLWCQKVAIEGCKGEEIKVQICGGSQDADSV